MRAQIYVTYHEQSTRKLRNVYIFKTSIISRCKIYKLPRGLMHI
jgi:hypothetical protein